LTMAGINGKNRTKFLNDNRPYDKGKTNISMKHLKPILLIAVLLIMGCAAASGQLVMKRYNQVTKAYGDALRWSEYEAASNFRKGTKELKSLPDLGNLKNFKITSYETKRMIVWEENSRVEQIVEIKYYEIDSMLEKTYLDHQMWEYDEASKSWYLSSDLPKLN